jgi:hypothetical protein
LVILFEILMLINSVVFMRLAEDVPWRVTVLPFYGIFMILCGLAAGIVGLIAVLRQGERSWLVWFAILQGLGSFLLIFGELLVPH